MNYIIDPMLFYNMSIFGALKIITGIFGFLFGCGMIAAITGYIYNKYKIEYYKIGDYGDKENTIKEYEQYFRMCKRYMFLGIIFVIIFVSLAIFIPDKTVCLEMIVAKNITKETVEGGVEALKSAVDYIIDKLQTLQ